MIGGAADVSSSGALASAATMSASDVANRPYDRSFVVIDRGPLVAPAAVNVGAASLAALPMYRHRGSSGDGRCALGWGLSSVTTPRVKRVKTCVDFIEPPSIQDGERA